MNGVSIRVADVADLQTMLDWAAAEGWNPGLDDAVAFHAADPEGFFVAEAGGAPVAAISVVNHSDKVSFLGLYICKTAYRGQGIGFSLWNHALGHAGSRTVGLDGVAEQEPNYAKSGFVRSGATIRFEGQLEPATSRTVRDFRQDDMPALNGLDTEANGYMRQSFLDTWLPPSRNRRTVVLTQAGKPAGFATIRRCREGAKVGPVIAPDADAGRTLVQAAAERLPATKLVVDVPSAKTDFIGLLTRLDFVQTFATARMYRGEQPCGSKDLIAIASMELG